MRRPYGTHRVSESLVEIALKPQPSLCVLSPPAWAELFTVWVKAFMHQARHISGLCFTTGGTGGGRGGEGGKIDYSKVRWSG